MNKAKCLRCSGKKFGKVIKRNIHLAEYVWRYNIKGITIRKKKIEI